VDTFKSSTAGFVAQVKGSLTNKKYRVKRRQKRRQKRKRRKRLG